MDLVWIDEADQLEAFCRDLTDDPVGLDTESDHFHAYQAQVCLIQMAQGDRVALIDPLALDVQELEPLFDVLQDPDVVTIFHAARNDLREIDRDYGVGVNNLFDTQIAARFLNADGNSLDWMLEQLVGVETAGSFNRFDWTTRPIPSKAKRYAILDVLYLKDLRRGFLRQLEKQGWLEPFQQQCEYVAESVSYQSSEFDPEDWRSLDGVDELDDTGRAVLQDLYRWRHEVCSDNNQSAVTLFPNGALLRLAHERPTSATGVEQVHGVPKQLARPHGETIAGIIQDAKQADPPPDRRPKRSRRGSSYNGSSAEQTRRYDALRDWRNQAAESIEIPTEFIATNDTLTKIAADPPGTLEELAEVREILPWQVKTLGDQILRVLNRSPGA